jgi:hypothetical protein
MTEEQKQVQQQLSSMTIDNDKTCQYLQDTFYIEQQDGSLKLNPETIEKLKDHNKKLLINLKEKQKREQPEIKDTSISSSVIKSDSIEELREMYYQMYLKLTEMKQKGVEVGTIISPEELNTKIFNIVIEEQKQKQEQAPEQKGFRGTIPSEEWTLYKQNAMSNLFKLIKQEKHEWLCLNDEYSNIDEIKLRDQGIKKIEFLRSIENIFTSDDINNKIFIQREEMYPVGLSIGAYDGKTNTITKDIEKADGIQILIYYKMGNKFMEMVQLFWNHIHIHYPNIQNHGFRIGQVDGYVRYNYRLKIDLSVTPEAIIKFYFERVDQDFKKPEIHYIGLGYFLDNNNIVQDTYELHYYLPGGHRYPKNVLYTMESTKHLDEETEANKLYQQVKVLFWGKYCENPKEIFPEKCNLHLQRLPDHRYGRISICAPFDGDRDAQKICDCLINTILEFVKKSVDSREFQFCGCSYDKDRIFGYFEFWVENLITEEVIPDTMNTSNKVTKEQEE